MENHYYDANGVYTCSAPANPGSLPPANALRTAPPRRAGFCPVLSPDGKGWVLQEDHRGRKGWLNGQEREIVHPGPLPDGWSDSRPELPDEREYGAKRRDDFMAETDPLLVRMAGYYIEAEAWKEAGMHTREQTAREKFHVLVRRFMKIREEIRSRHAYSENKAVVVPAARPEDAASRRFYLTASGVYHIDGCRYTTASGEWLPGEAIVASGRKVKPCSLCRPGDLEGRA